MKASSLPCSHALWSRSVIARRVLTCKCNVLRVRGTPKRLALLLLVAALPAAPAAPSAPTGLKSAAVTATSFTLKWTAATGGTGGVAGYEIDEAGAPAGSSTTTAFNVSLLSPSTSYLMTVKARDKAGNVSAPSAPLTVKTDPDTTKPSAPSGLVASSVAVTSFTLSWTASTDNVGVTGYNIYRNGTLVGSTAAATSFELSGLTANTRYNLTVRATDAAGNVSAASTALAVMTLPAPPSGPTRLVARAVTATSFTLKWKASTGGSGGIAAYDVYRDGALVGSPATTALAISGLSPDTSYNMAVFARDKAGNVSVLGATLTVTTAADNKKPRPPTGLAAANITATSFTVSWTASADNVGTVSYDIYLNRTLAGSSTSPSFDFSGLTSGAPYNVTVRAKDAAGNVSKASAVLTVTTASVLDQPPAVALTVPPPNSIVTLPTTLTISAVATDSDGTVVKVEFFRGATKLGDGLLTAPDTYSLSIPLDAAPGIALLTARATDNAGVWTDSAPVGVQLLPGLPYTADFESAEGFAPGSIAGQLGWTVTTGTASVVDRTAAHGTQSVALESGTAAAQLNQEFGPGSANPQIVFVDFMARPAAGADPSTSTVFDVEAARVAFVRNGDIGQIQVLNGDGAGAGAWQAVGPALPVDTTGIAASWHRLTLRLNYAAQTWDFYLDGAMVISDLAFRLNSASYLAFFTATGQLAATGNFDDFYAGTDNPLFVDANNDGIDDAWETAHGLSLSVNQRNLDPDGDGLTNIEEYVLGTDPGLADSDSDGMPDGWEVHHGLNPRVADGAEDPDGDGVPSELEYRLGRNPTKAAVADTTGAVDLHVDSPNR